MTTNAAPFKTGDLVRVGTRHGTLSASRWATPGTLFKVENCYPAGPIGSSSGFLVCAREHPAGGRLVDGYDTSWFELAPEDSDAPFKTGDRAVITDRYNAPHGLGPGFKSGTAVTVGDVTPDGGYLTTVTNDDGETYESYLGVSVNWLDPAPVEDDEIRVGDVVQVSDRHGALISDPWAKPGHLFTVTAVRHDGNGDGVTLVSGVDSDGRTVHEYGATWFDKVDQERVPSVLDLHLENARLLEMNENLDAENAVLRDMNERQDAARIAAEAEAKMWLKQVDGLDEELDEALVKYSDQLLRAVKAESQLTEAVESREVVSAALVYALDLLDEGDQQRVLGYFEGVSDGTGTSIDIGLS